MSARRKLRACFPALPEGASNALIESAVDEILNEHAHELADSIRRLRDGCNYEPDSPEYRHMSGAADWIDPLVRKR